MATTSAGPSLVTRKRTEPKKKFGFAIPRYLRKRTEIRVRFKRINETKLKWNFGSHGIVEKEKRSKTAAAAAAAAESDNEDKSADGSNLESSNKANEENDADEGGDHQNGPLAPPKTDEEINVLTLDE